MTCRVLLAGVAVALLVAGCGDASTTSVTDGGDDSAPGSSADAAAVDCGGSVYEPGALADAPPASSLPEGPAGAVDDAGAPAFDASQDWKVVYQSDERVELVRELDEPVDTGGGDVRTHESRTLERITDADNVADGTWLLTSAGRCAPRLATDDDLGDADLALADTPSPGDTSVDLRVRERACASGQAAEERIELVEVTDTADQVRLRIGVRAAEGDQTCQSNPATPFTVELSEPLGDRDVVDASTIPPRPIPVTGDR